MSNREWKLKCLHDQVDAIESSNILEEWLEKINSIPVKPGEAGFFKNFIIIPKTFQIEKEMHIDVRKIKVNKDYSLELPFEDLRSKFKEIVKHMDLTQTEQKEITKKFNKQNDNIEKLKENLTGLEKYFDSLEKISVEVSSRTKEEKFLKELKKYHDGIIGCLGIKDTDFLSNSGKDEAVGLIDLQQRYQEEFISKVDPS